VYNNSNITHAVHYEVTKVGDPLIIPTISSPNLVVNPKQFSSTITITGLEENTSYRLEIGTSFLGEMYTGGTITITTDANVLNPDPSTINQNIVS
jgi:hypothetical protein